MFLTAAEFQPDNQSPDGLNKNVENKLYLELKYFNFSPLVDSTHPALSGM